MDLTIACLNNGENAVIFIIQGLPASLTAFAGPRFIRPLLAALNGKLCFEF